MLQLYRNELIAGLDYSSKAVLILLTVIGLTLVPWYVYSFTSELGGTVSAITLWAALL